VKIAKGTKKRALVTPHQNVGRTFLVHHGYAECSSAIMLRVVAEFPERKIMEALKVLRPEKFSRSAEQLYLS